MSEPLEQVAKAGETFLAQLFEHLAMDVSVEGKPAGEETVAFEILGPAVGELKHRAELVSAITLLTSQATGRATGERVRCVLDIDGTLAEQTKLLKTAAADAAQAIGKTGRRAVFDNLSSTERRVVHTALVDDKRVTTRSEEVSGKRLLLVEPG